MAVISCHECNGNVSTEASACPHCGAPVKQPSSSHTPEIEAAANQSKSQAASLPTQSAGGVQLPSCPYCKAVLNEAAAVACNTCHRKWDKTSEDWKSAMNLWHALGCLFWLLGFIGAVYAAYDAVAGRYIRKSFETVIMEGGAFWGYLLLAILLNPIMWFGFACTYLYYRAETGKQRADKREKRTTPIQ